MMVKNEERRLPQCLDSVRGLATELIVADTGSTDATPSIATSYGAEVISFDFSRVDFAAARNCALERASKPWILVLDADEVLDPASVSTVEEFIARDENAGYFLERHNHCGQKDFSDFVVRLFPRRLQPRYRGRVHETVDGSIRANGGTLVRTPIRIHHAFSDDVEARRRRNHWYIEILKEEIAADPNDDTRLDFLAAEYHQLEMFPEATEVAEQIVRKRPRDPRAHLFAGVYHLLYQPDLRQARADFTEALRLRPGYPEAASFLKTLEERERAAES